jgi:hypothetical protein
LLPLLRAVVGPDACHAGRLSSTATSEQRRHVYPAFCSNQGMGGGVGLGD